MPIQTAQPLSDVVRCNTAVLSWATWVSNHTDHRDRFKDRGGRANQILLASVRHTRIREADCGGRANDTMSSSSFLDVRLKYILPSTTTTTYINSTIIIQYLPTLPTPMLGHWNAHLYFIIAIFRPLCLVIGMPSSILSSGHPNLMHKHWKVITVW